jgi:formamidopyrimidine-DNA glycosylase
MPELAEVEFYRKQWDPGLRQKILRVALHHGDRIFRGTDEKRLARALTGAIYLDSEARAKLMCFRFSGGAWLGIHLGMSGKLHVGPADHTPGRHDHLVLVQKKQALVFSDPRKFGRVHFHHGPEAPPWWTQLPPAVTSPEFTPELVATFFRRRARLAVKAALLVQTAFPGVGNWMADEILWQARIDPRVLSGRLSPKRIQALWQKAREICEVSLATIGEDFSDPPDDWLIHERWTNDGLCPRDGLPLKTATIGGRTTRWCPRCQR